MKQLKVVLIVMLVLVAGSGLASAGTLANATMTVQPKVGFAPTYVSSGDISAATSITLAGGTEVQFVPALYLGATLNDFVSVVFPGDTVTVFPLAIDLTGAQTFPLTDFLSWGNYTFTATSLTVSNAGLGTLNLRFDGTFHDTSAAFLDNVGEVRFGFTQTGGSAGAISESGTFATPPIPGVPEPATMVLLGSALLGVGIMRRRRNV